MKITFKLPVSIFKPSNCGVSYGKRCGLNGETDKQKQRTQQSQGFRLTCAYRPMTIKLQQTGTARGGGVCLWIGLISKQFAASSQVCGTKGGSFPADGKLRNSHHGGENHTCTFNLDCPQSSKREPTHITHTQHIEQHPFPPLGALSTLKAFRETYIHILLHLHCLQSLQTVWAAV